MGTKPILRAPTEICARCGNTWLSFAHEPKQDCIRVTCDCGNVWSKAPKVYARGAAHE